MDIGQLLPESFRATGPRGLLLWQWCAIPIIAALAAVLGLILGRLSRTLLQSITRRTSVTWDDALLGLVGAPLSWFWGIVVARILVAGVGFPTLSADTIDKWLRSGSLAVMFWVVFQLVGAFGRAAQSAAWATSHPSMRALVPLSVRVGRVAVATVGLITVLADLDFKVTSLLAGLGIGGLALALAGQKTVENLFGAFSIGLDQPFSVGDTITVDGTTGTVEAIGLRSTRIRTFDRTLITIPNGRLAEMKVESFAARDRIRFNCVLGLVVSTSSGQLRKVVAEMEAAMRAQPKAFQNDVVVRLRALTSEALELEINSVFLTTDYNEFGRIRQDLLLTFMEIVEKAGSAFAFPTRTLHVIEEERRAETGPGAERASVGVS
jgi:MscS family membrane protein